jgi:hypothetical protein
MNSKNTLLINISTLESEYKKLINEYEEAYQYYINILNKYGKTQLSNYKGVTPPKYIDNAPKD